MMLEFTPKGQFVATDCERREYVVQIFQEVARGARGGIWPRKLLRTIDGRLVQYVRKGHYTFLESGLPLRSDDPSCP
jgi:hypothetical protein